jgi:asparagine synthase (glutamine-hydrolysing)
MFLGGVRGSSSFSDKFNTLKYNSQFDCSKSEDFDFQEISITTLEHENVPKVPRFSYFQNSNHLVLLFGVIYQSTFDFSNQLVLSSILENYCSNNAHFMNELNGDFVLCFYEIKNKNLRVYSDHLGIIPFYYLTHESGFYFSSDQISLAKTFNDKHSFNDVFFLNGLKFVDFNATVDKRIKKNKGGHYLCFSNDIIEENKYWFPEKIKNKPFKNEKDLLDKLKKEVEHAVEIRCDRRYKASAHLSGGLDSSLVCVLARKQFCEQKDFYGLSLSPDKVETTNLISDEREIILEIAAENNIKAVFLETIKIKEAQENPIYYPFFGSFDEEVNLDFAARNGVNLIFSGWGGDEFISISNKGMELDLLLQLKFKILLDKKDFRNVVKTCKRFAKNAILPWFGIIKRRYKKYANEYNIYLKKEFQNNDKKVLKLLYTYRSRKDIHLNGLKLGHLSERTATVYNMGERRGVEYRYPLLDKNLIEFIFSIPTTFLYKKNISRYIMREICKDFLPESAFNKIDKTDFTIEKYFRDFCRENAIKVCDDIQQLKKSNYLYFFDFNKIEADIESFKKNHILEEKLIDVLNHIKSIDNFFKKIVE